MKKSVTLRDTQPDGSYTSHGGGYLGVALGDPAELVYTAMKRLEGAEFDTMVGRGLSGALVVPMLARAMNKWFAIVRKPNDGSHSSSPIEGKLGDKWIFVDDLMCSGNTLIKTGMALYNIKPEMRCMGYYLYGANPGAGSVTFNERSTITECYSERVDSPEYSFGWARS